MAMGQHKHSPSLTKRLATHTLLLWLSTGKMTRAASTRSQCPHTHHKYDTNQTRTPRSSSRREPTACNHPETECPAANPDARMCQRLTAYRFIDRRKGHENNLCQDFVDMLIDNPCTYCGTVAAPRGLDRLDNKRGHTRDNVVPCCLDCNLVRGDRYTPDEMRQYIGPAVAAVRAKRLDCVVKSPVPHDVPQRLLHHFPQVPQVQ